MQKSKLDQFKKLLAVQSYSRKEDNMIAYILEYIISRGLNYETDDKGCLYITKGETEKYVCVIAHSDTVHKINENMRVFENITDAGTTSLYGFDIENYIYYGIGGDDKCGIFIALEILDKYENIKLFFPTQEEIGCRGSYVANGKFFEDVSCFVMFDIHGNSDCTRTMKTINGEVELFNLEDEVYKKNKDIIGKYGYNVVDLKSISDVGVLSERFSTPGFLFSAGYYNKHKSFEYIILEDVENALNLGVELVENLQKMIDDKII